MWGQHKASHQCSCFYKTPHPLHWPIPPEQCSQITLLSEIEWLKHVGHRLFVSAGTYGSFVSVRRGLSVTPAWAFFLLIYATPVQVCSQVSAECHFHNESAMITVSSHVTLRIFFFLLFLSMQYPRGMIFKCILFLQLCFTIGANLPGVNLYHIFAVALRHIRNFSISFLLRDSVLSICTHILLCLNQTLRENGHTVTSLSLLWDMKYVSNEWNKGTFHG